MNLTEMIAALRFRLGNRKGLDSDIIREINFAQERLESDPTIPYWFLVKKSTISFTGGDAQVQFPPDFIREYDQVLPKLVVGDQLIPLVRMDEDDAIDLFGGGKGQPQAYVIIDGEFTLYPTPLEDGQFIFRYVMKEPKLEVGVVEENAWTLNASQMLMNKAGIALAQALRDQDALATFTNDFSVAYSEMMTRVVAREEANFDRARQ